MQSAWSALRGLARFGRPEAPSGPVVSVLQLHGVLRKPSSGADRAARSNLYFDRVAAQVDAAFKEKGLQAVALDINCPGVPAPLLRALLTFLLAPLRRSTMPLPPLHTNATPPGHPALRQPRVTPLATRCSSSRPLRPCGHVARHVCRRRPGTVRADCRLHPPQSREFQHGQGSRVRVCAGRGGVRWLLAHVRGRRAVRVQHVYRWQRGRRRLDLWRRRGDEAAGRGAAAADGRCGVLGCGASCSVSCVPCMAR